MYLLYIQEYLATEHVGICVLKYVLNIWYKGWLFSKKIQVLKKFKILICITLSFQFFEENKLLRVAGVYEDLGTGPHQFLQNTVFLFQSGSCCRFCPFDEI